MHYHHVRELGSTQAEMVLERKPRVLYRDPQAAGEEERTTEPGYVVIEGHVDIHVLWCHQRPCWCQGSMQSLRAILVSVILLWPGNHISVCGPCYHWRPCGGPWSMLPLEIILMSLACTAPEDHDSSCGPCCHKGTCWWSWSMLSQKAMWTFIICIPANYNEQGSFFAVVLITAESHLRKRDIEGFCDNHYTYSTLQSNNLCQKSLERTF